MSKMSVATRSLSEEITHDDTSIKNIKDKKIINNTTKEFIKNVGENVEGFFSAIFDNQGVSSVDGGSVDVKAHVEDDDFVETNNEVINETKRVINETRDLSSRVEFFRRVFEESDTDVPLSVLREVAEKCQVKSSSKTSNIVYRSINEIANITDDEILEALYDVGEKWNLSVDSLYAIYESIILDRESVIGEAISYAKARSVLTHVADKGHKFTVYGNFTPAQKSFMISQYPEMDLQFRDTRVRGDHPVAKACRVIDTFLVKRKTDVNTPCVDVGGDPKVYVTSGVSNVHCCCPKIDARDMQRINDAADFVKYHKRNIEARRRGAGGHESRDQDAIVNRKLYNLREFENNPARFYCNRKAQECTFEAPIGISIHAAYDIMDTDWPHIMMQHKMQVVHGAMLWSNEVVTRESGELSDMGIAFERRDGRIYFHFKSKTTNSYDHDYENYRRYGMTHTITYHRWTFLYRVTKYRKYSIDFEIRPISAGTVSPLLDKVLLPSVYAGMVKVKSIKYAPEGSTSGKAMFVSDETYVSSVAWKRLMDYCMSTGDGLTHDKVLSFITSLTQNIVINNTVLSDGSTLTHENLGMLSVAAFVITVKMRYEGDDLIQKFRKDEDRKRAVSKNFMGSITGFFTTICERFIGGLYNFTVGGMKNFLIENAHIDELVDFIDMFDTEEHWWDDSFVNDPVFSIEECQMKMVEASKKITAYNESVLPVKVVDAEETVKPVYDGFLEARDALIRSGRIDLLPELQDIARAYDLSEIEISLKNSGSTDSDDSSEQCDEKSDKDDTDSGIASGSSVEDSKEESEVLKISGETPTIQLKHPDTFKGDSNEQALRALLLDEKPGEIERKEFDYDFRYANVEEQVSSATDQVGQGLIAQRDTAEEIGGYKNLSYARAVDEHNPDYWIGSMQELANLSYVQERKVFDTAIDHAKKYVRWEKPRNGDEYIPMIPREKIALMGGQYEPNFLEFYDGECVGVGHDYAAYDIPTTVSEWMYGVAVDNVSDKGVSSVYRIIELGYDKEKEIITIKWDSFSNGTRRQWVYVEKDLSVVLGKRISKAISAQSGQILHIPKETAMMEMIAGAGKSYFIEWAVQKGDIILTARKEAVGEFAVKLAERGLTLDDVSVATVDSYLMNSSEVYKNVHIDEATMLHFGSIATVCQKAKPVKLYLYGDGKQISYVVRDTFAQVVFDKIPPSFDRYYSNLSRRFPADACALNSKFYGVKIKTTNKILRSYHLIECKNVNLDLIPRVPGAHYICFTNVDVKTVRDYFRKKKFQDFTTEVMPSVVRKKNGQKEVIDIEKKVVSVTTAHVAEGGTWDEVIIVRPRLTKYATDDESAHLLVASTRHRKKCTYVSATPNDQLWRRMREAISKSDAQLDEFVERDVERDRIVGVRVDDAEEIIKTKKSLLTISEDKYVDPDMEKHKKNKNNNINKNINNDKESFSNDKSSLKEDKILKINLDVLKHPVMQYK